MLTAKQKRMIVSPLIFIYGLFIALNPFLWIISFCSLGSLFLQPFIWLVRKADTDIKYLECFFDETEYITLNYIIGIFCFVLMPFYIVYIYVKENRLAF